MMWSFNQFRSSQAAVESGGGSITYGLLAEEGAGLYSAIGRRCLVICLCSNSIGSLVGYTSFINNRVVPLMLDSNADIQLILSIIDKYQPQYIWAPESFKDTFGSFEQVSGCRGYSLFKTGFGDCDMFGELALLLATSGSTGSPKMVRLSYGNVEANMLSIAQYLELNADERPITTLPMNYSYGLSIINSHLHVGAVLLMTDRSVMEREFWSFFREQGATSFGGVPYTYEMLDRLRFYRMELGSLKTMTQAGGKLSYDLHKKFAQYAADSGKRFIVMYGQTEATARMTYLPHEKALEKCGSIGVPIPGGRVLIIGGNGEPDKAGELIYEGDNVSLGYAESRDDLRRGDENNGRLVTGDMARQDDDGYLFITGRKKRFLKIFGSRVSLDEAEHLVKAGFSGLGCACSGADDAMYIFIDQKDMEDAVKKYMVSKTGIHHSAFKVMHIDPIPKNEAGKIQYGALEKYFK